MIVGRNQPIILCEWQVVFSNNDMLWIKKAANEKKHR